MGRLPSDNPWVGVTPRLGRLIRELAGKQGQTETTYLEAVFAEELAALPDDPKAGKVVPAEKWMRLVVDAQTHRRVKKLAGLAGQSMGDWVKTMAGREIARVMAAPAPLERFDEPDPQPDGPGPK